jgi:stage III sporulation protein AG
MNFDAFKKFFIGKKNKENILIILCIVAILIIFLSRYTVKSNKNKEDEKPVISESEKTEEYKKKLENELSQMISSIDGVGNSKIMITLANGTEYVYLSEKNKNVVSSEDYNNGYDKNKVSMSDNSQEKIILVDSSDGGKKALIKTEIEPTVKGVLVICDGGDDETVKTEVINIVSSLLNISTRKVSVSKLS